jgi:hypothetical protein
VVGFLCKQAVTSSSSAAGTKVALRRAVDHRTELHGGGGRNYD